MKNLNPALLDHSSEFFTHEKAERHLINGVVSKKNELPSFFANLISEEIEANTVVKKCLDELGIKSQKKRVQQYYHCNYSAFDHQADVTADGQLGPREYVTCPNRGKCKHEGKLCMLPLGLTKREIEVLKLIGEGLFDKEICEALRISQDTLRNHKTNISAKTKTERKPALGILAHKLNLL